MSRPVRAAGSATNVHPLGAAAPAIPAGREDSERRLWWPVVAGLLLATAGLFVASHTLEALWGSQSNTTVPSGVIDARGAIAGVLFIVVLASLRWRSLAMPALGAATGVGLYFLQDAALMLVPSSGAFDNDRANWEFVLLMGSLIGLLVTVELRRRRPLGARPRLRRPPWLAVGAYVLGVLAIAFSTVATRNGSTSALEYDGGIILVATGIALLATGLALFVNLRAQLHRVAVAAAVAYLVASSLGTIDWALRSDVDGVPFAVPALTGAGLLLIALALDARGRRR